MTGGDVTEIEAQAPVYRFHKPSGQARVRWATTSGINICRWRSPAPRPIIWPASRCGTGHVIRRWRLTTTCGFSWSGFVGASQRGDHRRGDSGYGVPWMYAVCGELSVTFTFGNGLNSRLQRKSDELLAAARRQHAASGQKQRLFLRLASQANSWPTPREVILKCEAQAPGTNRRGIRHQPSRRDVVASSNLRRIRRTR